MQGRHLLAPPFLATILAVLIVAAGCDSDGDTAPAAAGDPASSVTPVDDKTQVKAFCAHLRTVDTDEETQTVAEYTDQFVSYARAVPDSAPRASRALFADGADALEEAYDKFLAAGGSESYLARDALYGFGDENAPNFIEKWKQSWEDGFDQPKTAAAFDEFVTYAEDTCGIDLG